MWSPNFVNSSAMSSSGHGMKLFKKAIPFKKNKACCIRPFPLSMLNQLKMNKLQCYIRGASGHYLLSYQLFSRSEEHTSELQSRGHLVCRLLLEKKKIPT